MADERKIVIELSLGASGSNGSKKKEDDTTKDLTDILEFIQHPIKNTENALLGKSVLINQIYQRTKSVVKQNAEYYFGKHINLTENYKLENDFNNAKNIISKSIQIGSSIIGGAIIGSEFGPAGIAVGAALGFVSEAVNTITEGIHAHEQENIQLNTIRVESSYQMTRMGLIDNGRNTLN